MKEYTYIQEILTSIYGKKNINKLMLMTIYSFIINQWDIMSLKNISNSIIIFSKSNILLKEI